MTVKEAVRDNLLRMLYEKDMSIVALAKKTGIPPTTLYSITTGKVDTSITNAWKLSKGLGVKIDALVRGADES